MSGPLYRIDDRLIHGQVMTKWVKYTGADRIYVVDDGVAEDSFMHSILKMAAPSDIQVSIYTVAEAIEVLTEGSVPPEKLIVLVKYPRTVLELFKGGVEIKELNVGGIGATADRRSLYRNISASEEEIEIFKQLHREGVKINFRIVPEDKGVTLEKLLGKID